jgi:hypothetical protein
MCVCRFFFFSFSWKEREGVGKCYQTRSPPLVPPRVHFWWIRVRLFSPPFLLFLLLGARPTARPQLTPPVASVVVFLSGPVPLIFFIFISLLVMWQIGEANGRKEEEAFTWGGGCEKWSEFFFVYFPHLLPQLSNPISSPILYFIIFIIWIKLINHWVVYATGEWNGDANWVSEELGSDRTTNRINCRAAAADVIAPDDAQASSLLQLGGN